MIYIAKPLIGDEEKKAVLKVLDSGIIAQGPQVAAFEKEFAEMCGVEYALATTSGTTALQLALLALGIGEGDEVITTPFSFIASANSILYTGAKPVFADIDPDTFNLDPEKLEEVITKKTKAIMPVHLFGQPADMDRIAAIAKKHNLFVVEDACQAHGAKYKGKVTGSLGDAAGFSFYATKNMVTGEGGMATFKSKESFERASAIRAHGMKVRYYHEMLGYNFRMTDIAAAIGREQQKKLAGFNKRRQENAAYFSANIKNEKIAVPVLFSECDHVFHQYTVKVKDSKGPERDAAVQRLTELGVGTGIHYPVCLNEQQFYTDDLGYNSKNTPVAVQTSREVFSLPVHPALSEEDLETIVKAVNSL